MVTTKSLARDKELTEVAKSLQISSVKDILSPVGYWAGIGVAGHDVRWDDEEDVFEFGSGFRRRTLVLKSQGKPKEEVSLPMWVGAKARILQKLVDQDRDEEKLRTLRQSHLHYTAEIGDLCQLYTVLPVMVLNDVHRQDQAKMSKTWNDVKLYSPIYHLEKRQVGLLPNQFPLGLRQRQRAQRAVDVDGREICISYNKPAGCHFQPCKYGCSCLHGCRLQ